MTTPTPEALLARLNIRIAWAIANKQAGVREMGRERDALRALAHKGAK